MKAEEAEQLPKRGSDNDDEPHRIIAEGMMRPNMTDAEEVPVCSKCNLEMKPDETMLRMGQEIGMHFFKCPECEKISARPPAPKLKPLH